MVHFNEVKEIAKQIAVDHKDIQRLYIEQLESSNLFENIEEFNILYVVKKDIVYEEVLEISEKFGEISAVFESENGFEEYKIIYDNFIQGKIRFLHIDEKSVIEQFSEKYICVLDKENSKGTDIFLNGIATKIKEEDFLTNSCEFFWNALKFARKLSKREMLSITFEYRKMLELLDIHLKHYVLSENKYVLDLGKDDKFVFNYIETELFEMYLLCYSKLDIDSLWESLFNMCMLFRKISLKIAVNLRFEYVKELDRDTLNYLRELKTKQK